MSDEQEVNQISNEEVDDDVPQLSLSTLAALNEFLAEKNEREEKLRALAESAGNDEKVLDDVVVEEDWVSADFSI